MEEQNLTDMHQVNHGRCYGLSSYDCEEDLQTLAHVNELNSLLEP
jgi:hypothetical protein